MDITEDDLSGDQYVGEAELPQELTTFVGDDKFTEMFPVCVTVKTVDLSAALDRGFEKFLDKYPK